MTVDLIDDSALAAAYDAQYYQSHYTQVLTVPGYRELLAKFWEHVLFRDEVTANGAVLDFGCGLGQVTASLPNVTYFDYSKYATNYLMTTGAKVIETVRDIPRGTFDLLVSSHSLEHSVTPHQDLLLFRDYVKATGKLFLIIPIEVNLKPSCRPDTNQHFHCWTFQTITNLLLRSGWQPVRQRLVNGPFGLQTFARFLSWRKSIAIASFLGRLFRKYPSMLTVATRR